jgi:Uma2 family endonuclease
MPTETPRILLRLRYYEAAQEYLRNLPPEHFMEATPQATQREITLESLALVRARRPDVQVFNELLVQYQLPRRKKPGQVVPDNMVVIHPEPIKAEGSYDVPLEPVGPFWVLEYVSRSSRRKDYDENMDKYEHELKVPYYMLFTPHEQEVTLYRHTGERYASTPPNEQGRLPLPELELEIALLDGWVRYWFRGELLPLPGELLSRVDDLGRRISEVQRQRDEAETEVARLRAELEGLRRRTAEDK